VPSFAGEFDLERALTLIYGGPTWSNPNLKQYENFKDSNQAFIRSVFDAPYKEQKVEKHIVIAALTPQADYFCHACWPLLGGAIFRKDGQQWSIETENKVIEPGNGWGDTFELVQIGLNRHGVVHHIDDVHGGYEDMTATVLFPLNGTLLAQQLPSQISGTPGPGACEAPTQQFRLSFTSGNESSPRRNEKYFDLVVDVQWNEGKCKEIETDEGVDFQFTGKVCRNISRYLFLESGYKLLATQLSDCADWHATENPGTQ
jgi:hypothetical protein